MFYELVQNLKKEDIDALERMGVARARVSEWRKKRGLPSRRAVIALAAVTGVDVMELEREVMLLETEPAQLDLFRKLAGVAAGMILILGMGFPAEKANANNDLAKPHGSAEIYIVASVLGTRRRQCISI